MPFVAVGHYTTEWIGLHPATSGSHLEELEPVRQASANASGGAAPLPSAGCVCSTTTNRTTWPTISNTRSRSSGWESSPSFVREPEGNWVAERFVRTLKENLLWVRNFETTEGLRLTLLEFKRIYNDEWMLDRYGYRSPAEARRDFVGVDATAWSE